MRGQSRRVALCGVLCALAEVFLLLGGLVPAALYACPILAMLALLPVREECGVRFALVSWAAVGLLALLLWFAASITTGQIDWLTTGVLQRSVGYSLFGAFNPFLLHY